MASFEESSARGDARAGRPNSLGWFGWRAVANDRRTRSSGSRRAAGRAGFTLIELVIVIAVIAILAALLVPVILLEVERSRLSRSTADVKSIGKAISLMRTDTADSASACLTVTSNLVSPSPPAGCGGAVVPLCAQEADPSVTCWNGPYIREVVNDAWGNPYTASEDPNTFAVTVISSGPDGIPANADDITSVF